VGYKLYREIRDIMPADWTPAERLVAGIIADDANELTRISYIDRRLLCHRAGLTAAGLKRVLQRLASRGYEFRISAGPGRDGRPVYSARGHATDYLVPDVVELVKGGTEVPPLPVDNFRKAVPEAPLPERKGVLQYRKGGTPVPERGYWSTPPFPQSPQFPHKTVVAVDTPSVEDPLSGPSGQEISSAEFRSAIEAAAWAAVRRRSERQQNTTPINRKAAP
jgi:hypothetical protein